jgi:hypothetical protein
MDIPNLSTEKPKQPTEVSFSTIAIVVVIVLAVVTGFWSSRFLPLKKTVSSSTSNPSSVTSDSTNLLSTDKISSTDEIKVGQVYGNSQKVFKDTATGIVEKGSINGEGTHILNREGGLSQRASLTSSTVDLDLFVGKKVEVKGETNASTKTSWLLDVGSVKVLE